MNSISKSTRRFIPCNFWYRYLDNIIENPSEEKYRKIRKGNKAFQERVLSLVGAQEFLEGAGLLLQQLPSPNQDGVNEDFYVFLNEDPSILQVCVSFTLHKSKSSSLQRQFLSM